MKVLFKSVTTPTIWIADLFVLLSTGLSSCTDIVFRVVSGILTRLDLVEMFVCPVAKGLILLVLPLACLLLGSC